MKKIVTFNSFDWIWVKVFIWCHFGAIENIDFYIFSSQKPSLPGLCVMWMETLFECEKRFPFWLKIRWFFFFSLSLLSSIASNQSTSWVNDFWHDFVRQLKLFGNWWNVNYRQHLIQKTILFIFSSLPLLHLSASGYKRIYRQLRETGRDEMILRC